MLIYKTRRIRKENYNKLRLHRLAFAVFVDFREDYITFDFYIFHQAKLKIIPNITYRCFTKHGINWRRLEKRVPNTYLKFE